MWGRTRPDARRALTILALCFAGALQSGAVAHAHGVFPETERVAIHPSDPRTIVVQSSFGVLVTEDAGASWGWICRASTRALDTEDPRIVVTEDRAVVFAVFEGIERGEGLGCSIGAPAEALGGAVAIDVDRASDGTLLTVTSSGGVPNSVFRSIDEGRTWSAAGDPVGTVLFETLRIAPSDPSRVYLTGSVPPAPGTERTASVFRSDDGGATFARMDGPALDGARNLYLLGVDAADPDRSWLVGPRAMADDSVYESTDGGQTFREVMRLPEVRAFASDATTRSTWIGGREHTGLYVSRDGAPFESVGPPLQVACLTARFGRLWACTNEYVDGFSLGVSDDGGASFTPVLTFDQVRRTRTCPSPSPTADLCVPLEPTQLEAVLRPPTAPPAAQCGCRAPGAAGAGAPYAPWVFVAWWACRLSQRHRPTRGGRP